jgi:hypothetical protein
LTNRIKGYVNSLLIFYCRMVRAAEAQIGELHKSLYEDL